MIKCLNNANVEGTLRVGELYKVDTEGERYFVIRHGNGTLGTYRKDRFERI